MAKYSMSYLWHEETFIEKPQTSLKSKCFTTN